MANHDLAHFTDGRPAADGLKHQATITDIFLGRAPVLSGVEDGRCYVGHRGDGIYFDAPAEFVAECERAWPGTGHVFLPPDIASLVELKREVA